MADRKNNKKKTAVTTAAVTMGLAVLICCTAFMLRLAANNKPEMKDIKTASFFSGRKAVEKIPSITDFGDYEEISRSLFSMKPTDEIWTEIDEDPTKKGFYCIRTENKGPSMVFTVDPNNICGHKMSDFNYFWVDSVNSGFFAVVNIPGKTVDLSNYYVLVHDDSGNLASRLIVNCYEAETVKLNNAIFTGTLLAPRAIVEYKDTTVYGAVYTKGSKGNRAFYSEIPFSNYELLVSGIGEPVSFSNFNMAQLVLDNLKREYPEIYASYTDSYEITTADTAKIKSLIFDGAMIEKFYGDLDTMENLEELSVKNTKITSLDVSKLKKLKILNVSATNLGEIVFGENSSIEELNISSTGVFDSIDFSKLPNLKKLVVQDAGITAFTTEQKLFLGKQLTELDVSDNAKLTKFDATPFANLVSLSVAETKITELDVSPCTKLETLNANYTGAAELDVSENKNLKKVTAYGPYKKVIVASEEVSVGKLQNTVVEVKK